MKAIARSNFHVPAGRRRVALALAAAACAIPLSFSAFAEETISPDARPVKDKAEKAGTDVHKVQDSQSEKASPESHRVADSSAKASPDAARVRDGNTDKANPDSHPAKVEDRLKNIPLPAGELPAPETQVGTAEAVTQSIADTESGMRERKLQVLAPDGARMMISEIIGKNSRTSRMEVAREEQARLTREPAPRVGPAAPNDERLTAAEFLRLRLQGEPAAAPTFFRLPVDAWEEGADRLTAQDPAPLALRYLHGGRRYIYFPSKEAVPAVLLANAALDATVKARPAQEVVPIFHPNDAAWSGGLLPDSFKGQDAWVCYYPVDMRTMVASHDILFEKDSTRFLDRHAYDLIFALAQAIGDPALINSRFVIEDHGSAEDTVDDSLALSQKRAEAIAREMVRLGIAPERLLPVGFGELEARKPGDASGAELSKDRRLIVFRIGVTPPPPEPIVDQPMGEQAATDSGD